MSNYFSRLPDFEYISRLNDRRSNNDYVTVKNIFRRALIREDLFDNFLAFTKYKIVGDRRPDQIAYEIYGDSDLDWVILAANNIINVREEWPMSQFQFEKYIIEKYGSLENASRVKHYETIEIKDTSGRVFVPKGKIVSSDFTMRFTDSVTNQNLSSSADSLTEVTYYTYEERLQDERRNINILKSKYLPRILDEVETLLDYEPSTEYISPKLKKASNPNLG
jgi:hypothetical protein